MSKQKWWEKFEYNPYQKRSDFVKTYVSRGGKKVNYAFDLRDRDISKLSKGDIVYRRNDPYVVEDMHYFKRGYGREVKCRRLYERSGVPEYTYINERSKRFFYKK